MPKAKVSRPPGTFWWWLSLVVLAASLGLVFPSFGAVYAVTSGWDAPAQYVTFVFAGLCQGFVLGLAQAFALNRGPLRVPFVRWVLVTTLATGVAWLVGLVPGSFFVPDWTNPGIAIGMIAVVLLVVVIVPVAQWAILRRRVVDAWRWILLMSLSFALAVAVFLSGLFLAAGTTKVVTTMLTFSFTGWLGVLVYTVLSGFGVWWMSREALPVAQVTATRSSGSSSSSRARVAKATTIIRKAGAKVAAKAKPAATRVAVTAKKASAKVVPAVRKAAGATGSAATRATKKVASTTKKATSKAGGPKPKP